MGNYFAINGVNGEVCNAFMQIIIILNDVNAAEIFKMFPIESYLVKIYIVLE